MSEWRSKPFNSLTLPERLQMKVDVGGGALHLSTEDWVRLRDLEAENKRLRAALEEIATPQEWTSSIGPLHAIGMNQAWSAAGNLARAALEGTAEKA